MMKIYSSPYGTIDFDPTRSLLSASWTKDSANLDDEAVKSEIGKILRFVDEYKIQNIIVDARNYAFRENANIQSWITQYYMPLIMESSVRKYAIIVNMLERTEPDNTLHDDDELVVEYFIDPEGAKAWIES